MEQSKNIVFGYEVPFEQLDLVVALIAIAAFLPAVVIIHTIVVKIKNLFVNPKQQ